MTIQSHLDSLNSKYIPYSPQRFHGGKSESETNYFYPAYFYAIFELPEFLFKDEDRRQLTKTLISTCINAATPDRTINTGEVTGFGGTKIFIPTSHSITNSINLTFKEHSGLPVWNIIEKWCAIVNPHFGISTITNQSQQDYKGILTIVMTKPSGVSEYTINDIESSYTFHGVYPTSSAATTLDLTNTTTGATQDVPFQFDGFPIMSNELGLAALNEYEVNPIMSLSKIRSDAGCN